MNAYNTILSNISYTHKSYTAISFAKHTLELDFEKHERNVIDRIYHVK